MVYLALISGYDKLDQNCQNSLKMCPLHGHKRLDDDAFLASFSQSRKATVRVLLRRAAIKKSSPDNLRMSGIGLWARKLLQQ